jgi:hypothetical protein
MMLTGTLQNLSIPKVKNVIIASPEPSTWGSLLAGNELIAKNITGRAESQGELLRIAKEYTSEAMGLAGLDDISQKVIATGHQAVWHHCGIWAKNVAVRKLATVVDGVGVHIVLDHDICDTAMMLPKQGPDGSWCFVRAELEPEQKTVPLGLRRSPEASRIKTFVDHVVRARPGQFCNEIWSDRMVSRASHSLRLNNPADLITYLQAALNVALGLSMMYLPVSKLSESDAFTDFVISIMLDANNFAAVYNDAVTKQTNLLRTRQRDIVRRLKGVKTGDLVELPFWLQLPDGERAPLFVAAEQADSIGFGTASTALGKLDSGCPSGKADEFRTVLRQSGSTLRPKAVSLTLFIRLYLADWFVHGVGGSSYEPVTDDIIKNYYGMSALGFGVATCTKTLALLNTMASFRGRVSGLGHELHSVKHNPEKYLDESALKTEVVIALLQAKRERIAQSKNHSLPAAVRKSAWSSLSEINQGLSGYVKDVIETVERKIVESERDEISRRVCECREYFFGLFSGDELRRLAESLSFRKPG